ncbi:MAG TPA: hypothetical protein VFE82_05505 [Ramlibacter sp.]|jgi:hypothetical protein|uniref:glycosyltransferase family 9 protein n=1 Tax=Ramlibacter sp. TaxID=1917967 RepID=UPI002D5F74B0|nr:hypothetical protein [Ramlibacter sp.]HZY17917.1 hypothetical protein [Ramlibacter sp.]
MDATTPHEVGARWLAAMRAGDWEGAWRQTDRLELPRRRAQHAAGFVREAHHLVWDGSPFDGRSVLVRCEHGLGDTLQFSRFLPAVAARARELHVMVQPPLVELLRAVPGIGQVHNGWRGPDWPAHELEVEVMELAYALRASADTLPPPLPFDTAAASPFADLDRSLRSDGRLRVGLLWAASEWDPSRSIPLAQLRTLLDLPHVRFFGLQQGPAALQAAAAGWPIEPLWDRTTSVVDAAAAMRHLDLVVCVDGMPAHLAGSLGRPTWLLLKHDADWRWMDDRSDSPWYPAMRLWRQSRPGDWASLVGRVARGLQLLSDPTGRRGELLPGNAPALATMS